MNNLPISSKYRSQPDKPITEAEREDLATRLNEEFARGKVDEDDYRRLLDVVFAARTNGDLVPVAEVLPARATHDQPAIVAQQGSAAPGELVASGGNPNKLALVAVVGGGILAVLLFLLLAIVIF
ncbi:DUF1707 domain-containing protein [Aestuariimicrobium sp. p3-SID1156]|uniref:DUF1707 SHOCT-like domain-containing protein n=1 Tax=Aestuariimicrobium sp. p3-SID1156 TaxID=2916038 RepID=UPI00223C3E6E|nr:DUF1707 domain-containing protein [Aestuariimicrobium sp. p3-SID1156]MCT1460170.1 DUF1707 domain-containing protein [Aestuariimicrobium sp. p3-SID1156]